MDLRETYDAVMAIQEQLQVSLLEDAGKELQYKPSLRSAPDYRKVQALAATFTLQDFLANEIARAVAAGELPEDPED